MATLSAIDFFFLCGDIECGTPGKIRSLLFLPLGHRTNAGQFIMSDSDAVIAEPKHLTDSEMLHYPAPPHPHHANTC